MLFLYFFFFKQKTAYEMRISDWSSDVCSSDLLAAAIGIQRRDRIVLAVGAAFATIEDVVGGKVDERRAGGRAGLGEEAGAVAEIGRASCRERVCQYV